MTTVVHVFLLSTTVVLGAALVSIGLAVSANNVLGRFLVFTGIGYVLGGGVYLMIEPSRLVRFRGHNTHIDIGLF